MRNLLVVILLFPLVFANLPEYVYAQPQEYIQDQTDNSATFEPYKRGGFRSPRQGYNPGVRNPVRTTPDRPDNAVRTPPTRATPAPRMGLGGLFGGLALGTIIGSLFNPFAGFSYGIPFLSLLSLALWLVLILAVVRLYRRRKR